MLKTNSQNINSSALLARLGVIVMAAATVLGMTELTERHDIKVLTTMQPAYAFVNGVSHSPTNGDNNIRREKDEVGRHAVSYGVTMRTPSRTGKF